MEDDCIICGRAYRTCPGHPNMRWDDTWGLVDDGPVREVIMSGRIPSYGLNFRLESLPYEPNADLASRRYVLKANDKISIRSTRNSKHWTIFVAGPGGAQFPHGNPFDTLGQAMPHAIALA